MGKGEKFMRAVDIIIKKRDGLELSREEIEFFVQGFNRGEIPDYQASAWLMAITLRGMTPRETTDLTLALANSGKVLDLTGIVPIAVDKHSTGGVGDKTTLVVLPTVASCGLPVGKISGRGLSYSGGTLDKMESIPGYRSQLTSKEFINQLQKVGLVLAGQTDDLAPADGKLYALRDVTGTVKSIPLIASSIMSKKIAAGANAIVLDVKVGSGAFMDSLEEARSLAELMVSIAKLAGRRAIALLSDMNQPLGYAVGNALELCEAIQTLHGDGPSDFKKHCLVVAGHMLVLGGIAQNFEEGRTQAEINIKNGKAWERFEELVKAQGGDVLFIRKPQQLPRAKYIEIVCAPQSGYLSEINARAVGMTAVYLGAGRNKKGDPIDHAVGIEVHHKVGEFVHKDEPLFTVHANDESKLREAQQRLLGAHLWSDTPTEPLPLFYGIIE
jgi:pyrimidine-nucleoside phosphorylase